MICYLSVSLFCVCVLTRCVRFVIPFILDVRLVDAPAGVTQEEGHTGFLTHLPSAVLAFIFIARRIQPSLSPVDREVEFCVYPRINRSPFVGHDFFFFLNEKSQFYVTAPR